MGQNTYKKKITLILYLILILQISFITYFKNYDSPHHPFWDETYHIASGEKYLNRVMFMEPHPPLGKMFIALGEYIFKPNNEAFKQKFLKTDSIKDFPAGYSFKGVRFFSTLFSFLSSLILFFIFYIISKNQLISFIFTGLYLFDNSIIVHSRAAMLEGPQIFFVLLVILYFVFTLEKEKINIWDYLITGIFTGCAVSIKLNSAVLLIIFMFLFIENCREDFKKRNFRTILKKFPGRGFVFITSICTVFFIFWYIHFSLGQKIIEDNFYSASEDYKEVIKQKETGNIKYFPLMLRDNITYIKKYEKGVPRLDITKPDENGSHPITWPWGNKSINYRWETCDRGIKYLYLQCNPFIWAIALFSLILSLILTGGKYIFGLTVKNDKLFKLILYFLIIYFSYMAAVLQIERVMYLYHYFIPLIFTFILSFLIFNYIFEEKIKKNSRLIYIILIIMFLGMIIAYYFYSPLTYYTPLTEKEFMKRVLFDFWQLKPAKP